MSRIVVSLARRGREHASRALAIIELLADHHELLLIAPHSVSSDFLHSCRKYPRVEVFMVPAYASCRARARLRGLECATPKSLLSFLDALSLVENRIQRFAPTC